MDRAELIVHLTKLHRAGGDEALAPIIAAIRANGGPIHDPEWLTCERCNHTFERTSHSIDRQCRPCHQRFDEEVWRSAYDEAPSTLSDRPLL